MSLVPSSTPSTEPVLPERHAAVHSRRARRWIERAKFSLLVTLVIIACSVLYRGTPLPSVLGTRPAAILRYNDKALRQLAIKAPAPAYPSTSLANKVTGVVVATVTIDVNGKMRSVQIIDSPDAATGRAVADAVMQWVFRPLAAPVPVELISGNMIFYFHLLAGRGVVSSSEEIQAIKGVTPTQGQPSSQPVIRVIDETEFRRLRDTLAPVVVDTRSRAAYLQSHRDGAVNIPLSELSTRAGAELQLSRLIVIDCFAEQQHSGLCAIAVHILTSGGFSEVAVLNRSLE